MIELTEEQRQAIRDGKPIRLVDTDSQQALVLLREDLFERLKKGAYDDSPWTDEEMELLAQEDTDRLGWEGMEVYQDGQP